MVEAALERLRLLLRLHPGWLTLLAALALTGIGISAIDTVAPGFAQVQMKRQLPISLLLMLLCILPHPRLLGQMAYPLMVVSVLLLIFVILPWVPRSIVPRINGATSWIDFRVMNFQPSEMARVAFVLVIAWFLRYRSSHRSFFGMLIPFMIMLVPVGLMLKQPDLGMALLLPPALFVMLIAAGAKLRHMGLLLGFGAVAVGLNVAIILWAPDSMQILRPHQRIRIVSMLSLAQGDSRHLDGAAYQQNKSMILVGAGGFAGYGKDRATTVVTANRLPENHNDMIFAVVVSRWGLLGAWGIMSLYLVLFGSMLMVALRSNDPFARLASVGFAGMLFTQATLNMAMCVGLMPITGITLPFVSYGGSSLMFCFAMVGLVINFAAFPPRRFARPSFEFDPPPETVVP